MWNHFRRLLLGTIVEVFQEEGVRADASRIQMTFDRESVFRVPRINNYMRFKGSVVAQLDAPLDAAALRSLRRKLLGVWPDLLSVVKIPIGDRLDLERNEIQASMRGEELLIVFDLEAD